MKKEFISISPIGSISVLGISLGTHKDYVINHLSVYDAKENKNCVYIENYALIPNVPSLNICFSIDKDCLRVDEIRINACFNVTSSGILYNFLKKSFSSITYKSLDDIENGCIESCTFLNTIHKVTLFKQHGLGDDLTKYPVCLNIKSVFRGIKDYESLKEASYQIYLDKNSKKHINHIMSIRNKIREVSKFCLLSIITMIIILLLYLFALNGRYKKIDEYYIFDKWTKNVFEIN